ncbi:MAG: hypothetical protein HY658_01830 [Actinobacteria bacterium]|nr:hypothetical protein [Actinomycetota bacterium]
MTTLRFSFTDEPRDETYRDLIAWAGARCSQGLVVVRDRIELDRRATELLDALKPLLISERRESSWPGTVLLEGTARVFLFKLSSDAVMKLASAAGGLFEWEQPGLPEDLILLRGDSRPFLVTISHERDGYLDLHPSEATDLTEQAPGVALILSLEVS